MSSFQSDQDFRRAARQLDIDEKALRALLNTADSDELLQRAARVVADDHKEAGVVARIFGVNEKHLRDAVWYLELNRAREKDQLLQRAARAVVDDHKEIADAARTFRVNEKHLAEAAWYLRENRFLEGALQLGIDEQKVRRAIKNGGLWALAVDAARSGSPGAGVVANFLGLDAEALRAAVRNEAEARRREEEFRRQRPPWLEHPVS